MNKVKKNIEGLIDSARENLFRASTTIASLKMDGQDLKDFMECQLTIAIKKITEATEMVQMEL